MARPPIDKRCEICAATLTIHEAVRGTTCLDPECRRAAVVQREAERRAARERERRRRATERTAEAAADLGIRGPVLTAPVPVNEGVTEPLPEIRLERFLSHLRTSAREAFEEEARNPGEALPRFDSSVVEPGPAEATLLARGCATCRGFCCRTGGDTAWIDANTFRREIRARPDVIPGELVARWASLLPGTSYAESCVYHTETGCALPREMRASICNEFLCDDLKSLRSRRSEGEIGRVAYVATRGTEPVRVEWTPDPENSP